jgi:two-component system, OmpR family, catabolic regulation response regulator CreB
MHEEERTLPGQTVLVVEDTDEIRELVVTVLTKAGMDVRAVASGAACMEELRRSVPDVVVLDLGLPDADGTEICRQIRAETQCYVLMLTARAEEVDLLIGLAVGADGYMAKPFSPRELVARVRGILRRSVRPTNTAPAVAADPPPTPFVLDEERHQIRYYGRLLELSRYEYGILRLLVQKPGRVFTRDELLDKVWDGGSDSFDRTVDAHIKTLRAKLKAIVPELEPIRTLRGSGYALSEELPAQRL